jgi:lipopolysaccharide/colanic/teichoic acid biosynthesis glycosyltransferase
MAKISPYHSSLLKLVLDYLGALIFLILCLPLMVLISVLSLLINSGPVFFKQKRVGKNGKVFTMYKFRTMRIGAESERKRLLRFSEVERPVFKIYNDPRYTKFGKILAHRGLDELPQLINVLRGEMSLVGPRPLPSYEAVLLTKREKARELLKPGITSSWIVKGAHTLKFKTWMKLDLKYVSDASFTQDIWILSKTGVNIIISSLGQVF